MTDDVDLDARIAALDLQGKVRLLTGATMFTLQSEDSIGLGTMAFSDGPTGVRGLEFVGGDEVALLPNATLIASAWDEDLAHEVGQVLAEEAERQHIHVVLGPTINLHRSPLGGRLFEAYSEDPLLTGRLAAAYVKGLQGNGIGACLKHLVANESETDRHTVNSVVDESTLRELYLLPFEIAVEDSHPWSIMAAYNDVNGVPATEQDAVNNGIVKGEWGWDGLLMSDWFATKSAAAAANGGLDLVMPGPDGPWGAALVAAVESGDVDGSTVDEHLRRLLRLAGRVGALDGGRTWSTECPAPTDPVRRQQLDEDRGARDVGRAQRRQPAPGQGDTGGADRAARDPDHRHGWRLRPGDAAASGQRGRGAVGPPRRRRRRRRRRGALASCAGRPRRRDRPPRRRGGHPLHGHDGRRRGRRRPPRR